MTTFVQFHLLTPYPPSNPNRDDQGRPKQVVIGGQPRLRLSSQSIKRAVRETAFFQQDLGGHNGTRTKRIVEQIEKRLIGQSVAEDKAREAATKVGALFSRLEDSRDGAAPLTTTLAFVSPEEWDLATALAGKIASGEPLPPDGQLTEQVLRKADGAVDIAMFGRMLAHDPEYNREAAVQISHAFTTHRSLVEDDWFSAVDDLKTREEDAGAGHLGETGFGSGVYYLYACVNVDLLIENLLNHNDLAKRSLGALARALATATPRGKQNSFAHHPVAHYIRAEVGAQQPRDLSGSFFKAIPANANDYLRSSISALEDMAARLAKGYGPASDNHVVFSVPDGQGSLEEVAEFVAGAVSA